LLPTANEREDRVRKNSTAEADYVAFVEARRAGLRRLAYTVSGDWHEAEDLVQITLAKLYVAWPRIRRAGAEDAFARRTLMRSFLDERRRPRQRERPTAEIPDRTARTPEPAIEVRGPLLEALQELPAMQRSVVVLRHWIDLSVEQTAAALGISTGTVKSHNSRGLARLSELLADQRLDLRSTR
jgi:RNA polymerase sigma-70 factor (sigma-E family)